MDRKQSFLDQKIEVLKGGPKSGHFFKGFVHGFCPKIKLSLMAVFLQKSCHKKSLFDILNRKQSFLDQKIEVLKRTKKLTFPKGLDHEFCPNIEVFVIGVFYRN